MNIPQFGNRGAGQPIPLYPPVQCVPDDLENLPYRDSDSQFDLIVIGGGIHGTGVARDAAERGLSVLLLEKNDLGAGTTAYSTRLVHGGLRYLKNFDIKLVLESLRERALLLKNAPHLVKPLAFGIPIYEGAENGWLKILLGMMGYGALSLNRNHSRMPGFRMFSKQGFLKQFPGLNPDKLKGGAIYYDAQSAFPERICVENALAAHATQHAVIKTHAQVDQLLLKEVEQGNLQATGVRFTDVLTGEQFVAQGKVIANMTAIWRDQVAALVQQVNPAAIAKKLMGGTKGTHIIVRRFPGGPDKAIYVEAHHDQRPYFIIPWQKEFYLIGTSDLEYQGDLDQVTPGGGLITSPKEPDKPGIEEVDYLLLETNRVLPQASLTRDDILYAYAGVRPLPATEEAVTGKIPRGHQIVDHALDRSTQPGQKPVSHLLSLVGGKLTTYRQVAQELVDYAIKTYRLRRPDHLNAWGFDFPPGPCRTQNEPLPGAQGLGQLTLEQYREFQIPVAFQKYGLPHENRDVLEQLISLYGSRYENVLALTLKHPELSTRLSETSPRIAAQVLFSLESEFARTLSDVMRRMGANLNAKAGLDEAPAVADWMVRLGKCTKPEAKQQLAEYRWQVQSLNLAFKHPPVQMA